MGIDFIVELIPVAMYFMHVTLKFYPTSLRPLPCHSGTYGVLLSNLDQHAMVIIKVYEYFILLRLTAAVIMKFRKYHPYKECFLSIP